MPDEAKAASVFVFDPVRAPVGEPGAHRATASSVALPLLECSAASAADGPRPVCPHLAGRFEPFRQAAYWKRTHQLAVAHHAELRAENDSLRALLRPREQQLFGTKSESHPAPSEAQTEAPSGEPRGQQPGKPGPRRRDHSRLPAAEEALELPDFQRPCSCCGSPPEELPGTEDGEILEVEVEAYRRVYRRRRYRPTCGCESDPGIVATPPPDEPIPESVPGISVWVEVLLDEHLFYRPTYRLLHGRKTHGLGLSPGALADGPRRLLPLSVPVYRALSKRNQEQKHRHADETRWLVFVSVEGEVGYRWALWVSHSEEAVVFVPGTGRARDAPEEHLGPVEEGTLSVGRCGACEAMKQVKEGVILLAPCRAHVRRDFLGMARSRPSEEGRALTWVERIGSSYKDNGARPEARQDKPEASGELGGQPRQHAGQAQERARQELADASTHPARQKVSGGLRNHRGGLTAFVGHPEVPTDNNRAERVRRGPVVLRKNSHGPGAEWAGELAAASFSVFQTLCLWDMSPRQWPRGYLQERAKAGGQAPGELEEFLPWSMSEQRRKEWPLEEGQDSEDSS